METFTQLNFLGVDVSPFSGAPQRCMDAVFSLLHVPAPGTDIGISLDLHSLLQSKPPYLSTIDGLSAQLNMSSSTGREGERRGT